MKPRILDLFCGAGGCSVGYARAGFDVVGVDIEPQPRYPFTFLQCDALRYLSKKAGVRYQFDAIHASPPCQHASTIAKQQRTLAPGKYEHPNLIPPTRELLDETGLPYVIENVVGSELHDPITLCGSMFDLDVRRHRLFEANWPLPNHQWPCRHKIWSPRFRSLDKRRNLTSTVPVHGGGQILPARVVGVYGHLNYASERELRERAMEIDWMNPYELTQAIPPAYTEFIGHQLLAYLEQQPTIAPAVDS